MLTRFFEDYSVGDRGTTRARTITESDLVTFASLSGDWHPLHTDARYAADSRFGQRIAHGMLVLSVATGLVDFEVPYTQAFLGIDALRFRAPVFIGDTIDATWEVVEVADHDDGNGRITYRLTVGKDGATCVEGQLTMLAARRA